ncbi:hypothetical protein MVEN_02118100 [Mycena venus]|uniref:Uncharacterized protein n=1 Tax=Mycena venus TaxID=2733690 RepID=A0A8H7CI51_9AGAR|nr:hypothetical protein MVEN_02118100 [Mycena venus]
MDAPSEQSPVQLLAESEREIFELAALSYPRAIPKFMLVAWYVNKWVEPLLYRTIVFEDPIKAFPLFSRDILLQKIYSKPSFFQTSVRHLSFANSRYHFSEWDLNAIFSSCSGIVNLLVDLPNPSVLVESFKNPLPLRRLSINLELFFHPSPVDFTHPNFSRLTHLEVFDLLREATAHKWAGLVALPQLTHLSFKSCSQIFPVFRRILETSGSLQILVILTNIRPSDIQGAKENELLQDPRFVVMVPLYHQWDWQLGVHLGQDYWARAEHFVAQRKSGIVNTWFMASVEIFNRNSKDGLLRSLDGSRYRYS